MLGMFSICSYGVKRPETPSPPPWHVQKVSKDCFQVLDGNGILLAAVFCRDGLQKWSFGYGRLTSDEARRIANAIARLLEFLMQRQRFYSRGGGDRWKPARPYHVALKDRKICPR
jgi:hypothetical protein